MTDAKIEKVMTSNLLYTLFFTDGSSLEIYKSQFRGVSRIFLNGKEVRGKTL